MEYTYKISKDIDISIDEVRFFYEGCYGKNIPILDELEIIVNGDKHYNFINETAINIFNIVIKLTYVGYGVYSKIIEKDTRYNGYQYSTHIDIPDEVESSETSFYLYENPESYNNIEIGSSMHLGFGIIPTEFTMLFLQIVYKNKDVSKLPNYSIFKKLISRIKKIHVGGEITLKYELDDYLKFEHSIFPLLVELQNKRIVKIKGIEILEGDICFHIRLIDEIKNIKSKDIINIFGASDSIKLTEVVNIDFECKGMLLIKGGKTVQVTPFKLKLLEYTIQNVNSSNCSWEDVLSYVYGEGVQKSDALMSLIKKVNTDLRYIESIIQIGYVSDKYIFFKRT